MSWILHEGRRNKAVSMHCTFLLLELCPDEGKPPFLQLRRSPANSHSNAISLEHRVSKPNLQCQTQLFIITSPIEYP